MTATRVLNSLRHLSRLQEVLFPLHRVYIEAVPAKSELHRVVIAGPRSCDLAGMEIASRLARSSRYLVIVTTLLSPLNLLHLSELMICKPLESIDGDWLISLEIAAMQQTRAVSQNPERLPTQQPFGAGCEHAMEHLIKHLV